MIRETAEVINVLNALSCMITTFVYLHGGKSDVSVSLGTIVLIFVCYAIHQCLKKDKDCSDVASTVGTFLFLSLVLGFLTPVL